MLRAVKIEANTHPREFKMFQVEVKIIPYSRTLRTDFVNVQRQEEKNNSLVRSVRG